MRTTLLLALLCAGSARRESSRSSSRLGEVTRFGGQAVTLGEISQLLEAGGRIAVQRAAELGQAVRAEPERARVLLRLVVAAVHQAFPGDAMLDAEHVGQLVHGGLDGAPEEERISRVAVAEDRPDADAIGQ